MPLPLFRAPLDDPKTASRIVQGVAPNDEDIVSVVFGMTFAVAADGRCTPKGYRIVDEWSHEKARVTTRHTKPSLLVRDIDVHAWKNLTDVVVQGVARSDKPVRELAVRLEVQGSKTSIDRSIVATGDRWVDKRTTGASLSEPEPFTEMPLRYDRAYGGTDEKAEIALEDPDVLNYLATHLSREENEEISKYSYPRNPAGKGYVVREQSLRGLAWPNLEFVDDRLKLDSVVKPLDRWGEQPYPAAFDWFPHVWFPRCAFFDDFPITHDLRIPDAERRLGLFEPGFEETDLHERPKHPFANGAHPYLQRHRLVGDEAIRISHTSRDGRDFGVILPGLTPTVSLRFLGGSKVTLPAALDTVLVMTESEEVTLVYRATHFTKKSELPLYWVEESPYDVAW